MLALITASNQRNKFAPLSIMSANLQNWLDIQWSNPFPWLITFVFYVYI